MYADTQRSLRGAAPSSGGLGRLMEYLGRSNCLLTFLFSPEDTSGEPAVAWSKPVRYGHASLLSAGKVMFWVAVAILIGLWMGRLS